MKKINPAKKLILWANLSEADSQMICGGAAPLPDPGPDPNGTAGQVSRPKPNFRGTHEQWIDL